MFAIIFIYMMLFSFVTIIVSSLIYLVYTDWSNKRFNRRVNRIHPEFATLIQESFYAHKFKMSTSKDKINVIKGRLKQRAYEKVFQEVILEFTSNEKERPFVSDYMAMYHDYIIRRLKNTRSNGGVRHIQNVFMLGEFRHNHSSVISYLIEGVNSISINSRFNCMSAISKIGNSDALVKSLMITSAERRYMSKKVLTDILDNFEGDKDILNQKLVESFNQFNHELKLLVINYFNNEIAETPLKIFDAYLKTTQDKEEQIQLLKYFGAVQYPNVLPTIRSNLKSTYWEVRAIAAKTLSNYTDYFVLDDIIDSLGDFNWYVRTNTAIAILGHLTNHLGYSDENVESFINELDDNFAAGAMEYAKHLTD
ncbi:hypothetical protein EZV73_03570 [Acidaminobacter sp. JC074]|uniref:HEAT repeat domain-containing protein n=1 Tax=Acidaminobacter sp. JC074 TaxID=2530199 RepID=UPI001F1179F2|nr:hypothetical protein [Acidaminobacter sp. JC074]MCH4886629.1 hypothetical protein [Acidaminobacter sp. JC074]